jgi:very-short-patch-repair endonuclease
MNKDEQKVLDMYQNKKWSTYQIAERLNTYPNKIRRILTKHGIDLRNAKEAQTNALKSGRSKHPTAGSLMSEETKQKISETQGQVWDKLSQQQKEYRSKIGKEAWSQKTDEEKADFIAHAQEAIRKSSRVGSKLEHFLLSELSSRKTRVEFHKEQWLQNQNLQVDLYLPEYSTVIEVDGPSHFKPIWGEENLAKNIKADQQKTGLVLNSGLVMIRIKQDQSLTQRFMRNTLENLLNLLDTIKKDYPKENERYFEI